MENGGRAGLGVGAREVGWGGVLVLNRVEVTAFERAVTWGACIFGFEGEDGDGGLGGGEGVYCEQRATMRDENLVAAVEALTPQQRAAVMRFIEALKGREEGHAGEVGFADAADEFIGEHGELLEKLAQ